MWEKIKKFWIRKVLRKVYSLDDIENLEWTNMNMSEKNIIVENLYARVTELENNIEELVYYLSDVPTKCDKCFNYDHDSDEDCFKCENSGIIRKSQLMGWVW